MELIRSIVVKLHDILLAHEDLPLQSSGILFSCYWVKAGHLRRQTCQSATSSLHCFVKLTQVHPGDHAEWVDEHLKMQMRACLAARARNRLCGAIVQQNIRHLMVRKDAADHPLVAVSVGELVPHLRLPLRTERNPQDCAHSGSIDRLHPNDAA